MFNWSEIVQNNKPGAATPSGRARQEIFDNLTGEVVGWAAKFGYRLDRATTSTFCALAATPYPVDFSRASFCSKFSTWLYALDDCTDAYIDSTQADQPIEARLAELDTQTAALSQPLVTSGQLDANQFDPPLVLGQMMAGLAITSPTTAVEIGLVDLYQTLAGRRVAQQPAWVFCRINFTRQVARVVAAMRTEVVQSLIYQRDGTQPGFEAYLNNALITMCIHASSAAGLFWGGVEAAQTWRDWYEAMTTAARVVRLVNDVANYRREWQEGKVNALTIALAAEGVNPRQELLDDADERLIRARNYLQDRMATEMVHLDALVQNLTPTGLGHQVLTNTAFVIAMYQKGDFVLV